MNAFMLLTWREWRRDRPIFLSVVAGVPAVALLFAAQSARRGSTENAIVILAYAAWVMAWLGVMLPPLLAAHAMAGERADRSARFVASLPVSRACRLCAKVVVLLGLVLLLWAPLLSWLTLEPSEKLFRGIRDSCGFIATFTLLTTAITWLLAAWLDSVIIAAAVAISTPIAAPILFATFEEITGRHDSKSMAQFFDLWLGPGPDRLPTLLTLLVAAGLFAAGTAIYLRRAE